MGLVAITVSILVILCAVALALAMPLICGALFLAVQLLALKLPPPSTIGFYGESDFARAIVSLLLWYLIACVAVSVFVELGWIAACFAVAACASLPFVDSGGGIGFAPFSLSQLDEGPLTLGFIYVMLPLLCQLPLMLAGPGAFIHCFLWGHLCWASARAGLLTAALVASVAVALVINSFDGFAPFDGAPLFGTVAALPAGKAIYRFFCLNKPGFFAGVLLSSLVSRSVRVLLATLVGTAISVASTVAASVIVLIHQSRLPANLIAMLSSGGAGMAAARSGASAAPIVQAEASTLRGASGVGPRVTLGSDFAVRGQFGDGVDDAGSLLVPPYAR